MLQAKTPVRAKGLKKNAVGKELTYSCLKCTPKVSPRPKHDIHDETHNQAHLHASPNRIGVSLSWNAVMMDG